LEFVSLKVYDITGKEVMTSVNETKPAEDIWLNLTTAIWEAEFIFIK
jgi:hypothetical protein